MGREWKNREGRCESEVPQVNGAKDVNGKANGSKFSDLIPRSMANSSLIPWYLDQDLPFDGDHFNFGTESTCNLAQPWRNYWPPKSSNLLDLWRGSDSPEVLSWRFDPAKPFDRPWRVWTKSKRAIKEPDSIPKDHVDLQYRHDTERWSCMSELPNAAERLIERPIATSPSSFNLDDKLRHLNLPLVHASINYLAPLELYKLEKPYHSRLPAIDGLKRSNMITESHQCQIFEVSGNEHFFKLDDSGFEFANFDTPMDRWTDSTVCEKYFPRLAEWLRGYLKCEKVFVYAYNFRGKNPHNAEKKSSKTPFKRAHCDSTPSSCSKRLKLFFPDEAEKLMQGRVRFLNIWRPIMSPIQDCPLAFLDLRTTKPSDLVRADIIFPHYYEEAYEVVHNPSHRWFYKKDMAWDDVLLFKLGDNKKGVTNLCPHSAFMDPSVPKGVPSRISIEVRVIAIG